MSMTISTRNPKVPLKIINTDLEHDDDEHILSAYCMPGTVPSTFWGTQLLQ